MTPTPNAVSSSKPNAITITFSKALDASTVNASTIRLMKPGIDGVFGTADDVVIVPDSLALIAPNQIRLALTNVSITNGQYRVLISGTQAVANWKLDDNAGTTATDSSVFAQSGTFFNTIAWEPGIVNSAVHFQSTNSYIEAPNLSGAFGLSDFSVTLYAKTTNTNYNHLIGNRKSAFHSNFWQLHMVTGGAVAFEIDETSGGSNYATALSSVSISDGAWHLIKATRQGRHIEIFIDNVLSGTADSTNTTNMTNASSIILGNNQNVGLQLNEFYTGQLDEVVIENGLVPGLRDQDGFALDGEFSTSLPTGNGTAGGDFVAQFSVNIQAPIATDQAISVDEDSVFSGSLPASDPNGDTISYSVASTPQHGDLQLNPSSGAYTYVPNANYFGTDSFQFKANDGVLDSNIATISITVKAVNDAPTAVLTIASGSKIQVGSVVQLSAANSSDIDGNIRNYAWDFGDGVALSTLDSTTLHSWSSAGVYTVTLSVIDSGSLSASATQTIVVATASAGAATAVDTDGDGFSDEMEVALKTDPVSALSTPLNNKPLAALQELNVSKLAISLNLKTAMKDSILLSGTLPVSADFSPGGETVTANIGGVIQSFTLNDRGAGRADSNKFALQLKRKKGLLYEQAAKFTLKIAAGSFLDELDAELSPTVIQENKSHQVLVSFIFNDTYLEKMLSASTTSSGTRAQARTP